jgi:ADP-ribosylation factor 2-binding protein
MAFPSDLPAGSADADFEDIVDVAGAPDPADRGGVQAGGGEEDEFEITGEGCQCVPGRCAAMAEVGSNGGAGAEVGSGSDDLGGGGGAACDCGCAVCGDGDALAAFDAAVGVLEELLVDDAFSGAQEAFARAHCAEFDEGDENKLCYTSLFEEYTTLVEGFIEARLEESMPGFDMVQFMGQIEERHEEVAGDVLDVLASLADFDAFKALMLDYRRAGVSDAGASAGSSSGAAAPGASSSLSASSSTSSSSSSACASSSMAIDGSCLGGGGAGRRGIADLSVSVCPVFSDEQADGTPMPDLNLTISPVVSPVAQGKRAGMGGAEPIKLLFHFFFFFFFFFFLKKC